MERKEWRWTRARDTVLREEESTWRRARTRLRAEAKKRRRSASGRGREVGMGRRAEREEVVELRRRGGKRGSSERRWIRAASVLSARRRAAGRWSNGA